ncbi:MULTISPECIES: hypothetical protein [Actinomycetaceae]|uniref:Cyclic nucleotide-binding domain-containing protein n=1 Tax=Schaalia turicensis TaxID=131111 RepID=A0ABZ0REK0_9ACTO|nr:hypothetical protein [Actinotignum sanguinis]WPJ89813.1 hypothetical protein R0V15_04290 [Schaalia turicensis]MDK8512590.1 hypothetical protein [Actinotignum sanguinis]MDK8519467.1 hypothetical protein [Actinotignum sanguinis]MDK8748340.1 hypothetical protein [Actinotignum sanguinis]MDV2437489.1 hypothetical protein [Actinotignum sanguinis]
MAKRPSMRDPETPMSAFGTVVLRRPAENVHSALVADPERHKSELAAAERRDADNQVRELFPEARIWYLEARPSHFRLKSAGFFIMSMLDLDAFRGWLDGPHPRAFYLVEQGKLQLLVRVTDTGLEAIALPAPPAPVAKRRFTIGRDEFLRADEELS